MVEKTPRSIVVTIKIEKAGNNMTETTGNMVTETTGNMATETIGNMATETTGNIPLGKEGSMCPETRGNLETEMAGNNKDPEITTGHAPITLVTGNLNHMDPELAGLHLR